LWYLTRQGSNNLGAAGNARTLETAPPRSGRTRQWGVSIRDFPEDDNAEASGAGRRRPRGLFCRPRRWPQAPSEHGRANEAQRPCRRRADLAPVPPHSASSESVVRGGWWVWAWFRPGMRLVVSLVLAPVPWAGRSGACQQAWRKIREARTLPETGKTRGGAWQEEARSLEVLVGVGWWG
jgi:hypothetical protein